MYERYIEANKYWCERIGPQSLAHIYNNSGWNNY